MATIVQDTVDAEASDALFDEVGNVNINGIVRAATAGTNTDFEKKKKGEADGKDKIPGKNQNDGGTDRKVSTQGGQATETEGTGADGAGTKGATETPAGSGLAGTGTTTGGITQFTRQTSTETTAAKPQNTPQLKETVDTGKLFQQSQLENLADGLDETGEKAA